MRQIHIIGGGTVFHVRPHLALCAPAYGAVVCDLREALYQSDFDGIVHAYTTKMAGNRHSVWTARDGLDNFELSNLETNEDIAALLDRLVADDKPKIIFLPAALCDFDVAGIEGRLESLGTGGKFFDASVGKQYPRLTSDRDLSVTLKPSEKIIQRVRKTRKDIFLVGFKTTTGATPQDQFDAGLRLVKQASCNLVLANDLTTRLNMVVTPEQAPHYVSTDRQAALRGLVSMALQRAEGHFTRSTVVEGNPVAWNGDTVPESLREVVDHCIKRGAYKPFMGKTVGHFAFKVEDGTFVTSRRGVNFNELEVVGMVAVRTDGDDKVIARGAKPSVGGQSQRIIFAEHPDLDCILHFHCPLRPAVPPTPVEERHGIPVPSVAVRSQEAYECGSHECGQNTSDGLKSVLVDEKGVPLIKAVMLDKHGPNIVFNRNVNPAKVIEFIERHWDLERSTSEVTSP